MIEARPRVVVTGAAGGIGAAVCRAFADSGWSVVGLSREGDSTGHESYAVNLAVPEEVLEVAEDIAQRGLVSAVVHVAAAQPMAPAAGTTAQQWQETLMVNVVSLDLLVGGLRPSLTESAAVIAVSSVHARATTEGICAYATSKAALEGWVRAASMDLGPAIRTVGITLGAVDGPKLQEGFARWGGEAQARMNVLRSRTPAGRIAQPDEVAEALVWLASPAAAFITGTSIAIDGGALARLGSE